MANTSGVWLAGLLLWAGVAHAADGRINSFTSNISVVPAGTQVNFSVDFWLTAGGWSGGDSDPNEPAATEDHQVWERSWYETRDEHISQVWLQAPTASFRSALNIPTYHQHTGSWQFSMLFPKEGVYDVTVSGGWTTGVNTLRTSQIASRDCSAGAGGEALSCTAWVYTSEENNFFHSGNYGLASRTVRIEVVPVSEPSLLMLVMSGLLVATPICRRVRRGKISRSKD